MFLKAYKKGKCWV